MTPLDGLHDGVKLQPHMFSLQGSRERREHRAVTARRAELRCVEHAAGARLFGNRECARASGIGCVESFYRGPCELARLFRKAVVLTLRKESLERDVGMFLADEALQPLLDLREQSFRPLLQLALAQHPALSGGAEGRLAN